MKILTLKKQLLCAAIGLMLCCCSSLVMAQGKNSVTICHNGNTIQVNQNAVNAHLNHGDALGACPGDCINPDLINPNCFCILIYNPVCGCDGNTYSNSCFANCAGVTSYTPGECQNNCVGEPLDIFCITLYDPVCGCDGNTYSNGCFATAAGIQSYTPGPCSGKRANDVLEPATLSPNPASGIAVLKWTPRTSGLATVTVIDMVGKVVAQSSLLTEVAGGMNTYNIHVEDLETGIYTVQLSSGGTVTTQKLMVTH